MVTGTGAPSRIAPDQGLKDEQVHVLSDARGKPYRGLDGMHAAAKLLAEIGEESSANDGGGIEWKGYNAPRYRPVLCSMIVILGPGGEVLNDDDTTQIAWDGLVAALREKPGKKLSPNDVVAKADPLAAAFFRKTPARYVLLSS
jgi:hypothetical protein